MNKLHAKSGSMSTEYGEFLPALDNSEYEADADLFETEIVEVHSGAFTEFVKPGRYVKVTGMVKVTRYYLIDSQV